MWILIVFFVVGTGGYSAGLAVNFQEFKTKQSCEFALSQILLVTNDNRTRGLCVPK